jgi:hypothetical protein
MRTNAMWRQRAGWLVGAVALGSLAPLGAQSVPKPDDPAAAAAARVIWFKPKADPQLFKGVCPATITFTSVINANRYPVMVEYQWERSDGAKGPQQSVTLNAAGTIVSSTWKLGAPGSTHDIFERVHVLTPNDARSGDAHAKLICDGGGAAAAPAARAATAGDAPTGFGGASGALTNRVNFNLSYDYTEHGAVKTIRHVRLTLVRGLRDSVANEKDPALKEEKRVMDSVASANRHATVDGIVYAGHWLWVMSTNDSVITLNYHYGRPGADSVTLLLIDRADHVGGLPQLEGVDPNVGPLPPSYWAAEKDFDRRIKILRTWLQHSAAAREFLK